MSINSGKASTGTARWRFGVPLAILTTLLMVFTGAGAASAATLGADDFEDGDAAGWTTTGGTWIVNRDDDSRVLRQSSTAAGALARTGALSWRNYTVTADVTPESSYGLPGFAGVVARASSTSTYYALVLRADDTVALVRAANGVTQTLAARRLAVDAGETYRASLTVEGQTLSGTVGGVSLSATDGFLLGGPAGLLTTWTTASFDNVLIAD